MGVMVLTLEVAVEILEPAAILVLAPARAVAVVVVFVKNYLV
jgi:hypothetical protein